MKTSITLYLGLLLFAIDLPSETSWLSNVPGINTQLAKKIGGQPAVLNAIQQPVEHLPVDPTPKPVPVATVEQKRRLEQKLDAAVETFKQENERYQSYAAATVFGTIILGLLAAIAGFLKQPITAGILSLLVAGSTGVTKAFPIRDRASYYQTLYGQALTLQVQTSLGTTMTVEDYNDKVKQLTTILLFASKLPGVGDAGTVAEELIKSTAAKQ